MRDIRAKCRPLRQMVHTEMPAQAPSICSKIVGGVCIKNTYMHMHESFVIMLRGPGPDFLTVYFFSHCFGSTTTPCFLSIFLRADAILTLSRPLLCLFFCPSLPFSLLFLVFFLTIYCHCDVTITEESSQSVLMSGYLPIPTVIGPFFFLFGIQPPTCAHNSLRLVVYILATISAVPVQSHYTE